MKNPDNVVEFTPKQSNKNNDSIKATQDYLLRFFKKPIDTALNAKLDFNGGIILLAILPCALFLAIWSLINSLINVIITTVTTSFGGLGALMMPNAANMASEMMTAINWAGVFGNAFLIAAVWFGVMMFAPLLISKLFKSTKSICLRSLFLQTIAVTIPTTVMAILAMILGFAGLTLWLLSIVIAIITPIILHFFIINKVWELGWDKTLYITLITHLVIFIVIGLLISSSATMLIYSLTDGVFW